jgi:hypothetical protein
MRVTHKGPPNRAFLVRSNYPLPMLFGTRTRYYEITVENRDEEGAITCGMALENYPEGSHPGWQPGSFAWHGDDALIFGECSAASMRCVLVGRVVRVRADTPLPRRLRTSAAAEGRAVEEGQCYRMRHGRRSRYTPSMLATLRSCAGTCACTGTVFWTRKGELVHECDAPMDVNEGE